jgi:hypothetical protein
MIHLARLWRPALSLGVLVMLTGCIEWAQPTASQEADVQRYIAGVQTLDGLSKAVLVKGTAPAAGTGPTVTAQIPALVLLGGTIQVTAASPTPFTKVNVNVPGVADYWELTLPAATTSIQVLIVFSQDIPKNTFTMNFGGGTSTAYGARQTSNVSVISVGTGDVQVNITWDSKADVDLHVIDPTQQEIYWANRSSTTGGQLDLDSNAGCGSDGPRAENIFWASGLVAPRGDYQIRVDYWSSCGAALTNYVVTVNARGKPPQIFSGVLTGLGDGGGKGSGRNITLLSY